MNQKVCSSPECPHGGKPQALSEFGRNKTTKDGLDHYCKACRRIKDKRSRQQPGAAEKAKERSRRWRYSEDGRQKHLANLRAYYAAHREKRCAETLRYFKTEKGKATKRAYYQAHRAIFVARSRADYARERGRLVAPPNCEWCDLPAGDKPLHIHHWLGYAPEHWFSVKFVHGHPCHRACKKATPDNWPTF